MKRFIVLFICVCSTIGLFSQNNVVFKLLSDGSFTSTQGSNYVVLNYTDKSALELYNMVRNNIFKLYKDPASVLLENPHSAIKVHNYIDLGKMSVVLIPRALAGYVNLQFQFKDGKIRIDAPKFDEELICVDGTLDPGGIPSYNSYAKGLFKNGQPRSNKKEQIYTIELKINTIINYLLGLTKEDEKDDW